LKTFRASDKNILTRNYDIDISNDQNICRNSFKFQNNIRFNLERCVAVSSPFLAKRFCTVYSARYSVYILFIVSFIFFTSTFPIIYATDSNRKKCIISVHLDLIQRVYQTIILYGIPDLLLLSNIFTVYTLIRRRIQQNQQHENNEKLEMRVTDVNSNRKQRQLTIMLVSVNLAFYLFTTPAAILYIAEYSPSKHADIHTRKRRYLLSQISVILLQLPNAVSYFPRKKTTINIYVF
jgi:hypothetical protein